MNNETLKISSNSNPSSVAGAIANIIGEKKKVEVRAVGAGAVNQAVKGIAIARSFVASQGIDLVCVPAFANVEVKGENITAIKFIIKEDK